MRGTILIERSACSFSEALGGLLAASDVVRLVGLGLRLDHGLNPTLSARSEGRSDILA